MFMRGGEVCCLKRDDNALTAVIEFLSAFALFLMILTAFLSLAQLQMGSNDPNVDRIDRFAVQGLDRLTSDGGWFVPMGASGLDYANSTSEWHLLDAVELDNGRVQTGLVKDGVLDQQRIEALRNVSEEHMALGLGIDIGYTLFLSIEVIESNTSSRIGEKLFSGGTPVPQTDPGSQKIQSYRKELRACFFMRHYVHRYNCHGFLGYDESIIKQSGGFSIVYGHFCARGVFTFAKPDHRKNQRVFPT